MCAESARRGKAHLTRFRKAGTAEFSVEKGAKPEAKGKQTTAAAREASQDSADVSSFYADLVDAPKLAWSRAAPEDGIHGVNAPGGKASAVHVAEAAVPVPYQEQIRYRIPTGNVGYQLLKKAGWTEQRGLGAAEQGVRKPVELPFKADKRGIGAGGAAEGKGAVAAGSGKPVRTPELGAGEEPEEKPLPKKARKAQLKEEQAQEQQLERAFFRAFWPENV